MIAHRFGVVTTLSCSIAALENNLTRYGLDRRCSGVRASDIPVLELEKNDPQAMELISQQIQLCVEKDGAEAIVLGCAGMTDLANSLEKRHGLPVLDGVVCATKLVESMVALGLNTSGVRTYAKPVKKQYCGDMERFSPLF